MRRYAEKNGVSLRQLLELPPTQYAQVFSDSGYRP
ncbi:MAG: hypothetical protein KatS3mg026_1410 [Bacteroidia bacterium]|nr:MAG: hypothetical protein KatS3mg026_1410 [Bacteroidia bacterium]